MKCHYEVLQVEQKATDEQLKKSYRKMALQWHPDKNPNNLEESKKQFQLIQAAYEVLSDPHERAFYDRNRESILRGKASGGDTKNDIVDLFAYFSTSCYKGFNDSEKGFYTVYRNLFEKIAASDLDFVDDEDEEIIIPNFGNSNTDLEDVAQFYGYWTSYCTMMSFAWEDTYDVRQAPNRWVEKKIERENKKGRDKAKKTYNEDVRNLVLFVRKRDKRWLARKKQLEEKVTENARKQEAEQSRQREVRQKLLSETMENQKESLAQYEDQLKSMEAQFESEWGGEPDDEAVNEDFEHGSGSESSEDPNDVEDLFCIVCDKAFKTEKAKKNHEKSKKHKDNLQVLKNVMDEDDALFIDEDLVNCEMDDTETQECQSRSSKKKKKKKNKKNNSVKNEEKVDKIEEKVDKIEEKVDKNQEKVDVNREEPIPETEKSSENVINTDTSNPSNNTTEIKNESDPPVAEENSENIPNTEEPTKKLKGKKAKEARKAAAREASSLSTEEVTDNQPKSAFCSSCGQEFPSRTKLFSHIKITGHAELKNVKKSKSSNKIKSK